MLSGSTWVYGLVSMLGCLVSDGECGSFWFLPAGGEGRLFWFLPIGGGGGRCSYSSLGERVMFFPLGRFVLRLLLLDLGGMVMVLWSSRWVVGFILIGSFIWYHSLTKYFRLVFRFQIHFDQKTLSLGPKRGCSYSSLGERVGEMVMVFPLGKLVSWDSLLGERVGCMVSPRWGRGWAAWLLPTG